MGLNKKGSCSEMSCIMSYVDKAIDGEEAVCPGSDYPIHKKVLSTFQMLMQNEKRMSCKCTGR